MKNTEKKKRDTHLKRRMRVRAKIKGTKQRPRLSVYRSLSHISAQLIDDEAGRTIVACSDRDVKEQNTEGMTRKCARAYAVGVEIARRAKDAGISKVVFDRGGRKYHGRVKAVADGAREGGLEF